MRRFGPIFSLLVFFTCSGKYMAQGWKRQYYFPGIAQSVCRDVIETPEGNYVMFGTSVDSAGRYLLTLACADNSGKLLWYKNYGGDKLTFYDNHLHVRGMVVADPAGFYHSASTHDSAGKAFVSLFRFNYNGDTLWSKQYRVPAPKDLIPQGMTRSADGGLLITGLSQAWGGDNTGQSCFLLKTDLNGNELWRKFIIKPTDPKVISGVSVVQDSASKKIVIVGGQYIGNANKWGSFGAVIITDSLGNNPLITTYNNYNGKGNSEVIQLRDTNFLVAGTYNGNSDMGGFRRVRKQLVKLDLNGDSLWSRLYDTLSRANWNCVLFEQANGDIMMGGHLDTLLNYKIFPVVRLCVYRTDSEGNLKWRRFVGFADSTKSSEYMRSMNRTKDGGFIIAAWPLWHPNPVPFTIIKIDSNACDSSLAYCELKLGLPEDLRQNLSVYPVPCDEKLKITNTTGNMTARLYNLKGVLQKEIRFETMQQEAEINTTSLTPGVYLLQLQSGAAVLNRKVIVEH